MAAGRVGLGMDLGICEYSYGYGDLDSNMVDGPGEANKAARGGRGGASYHGEPGEGGGHVRVRSIRIVKRITPDLRAKSGRSLSSCQDGIPIRTSPKYPYQLADLVRMKRRRAPRRPHAPMQLRPCTVQSGDLTGGDKDHPPPSLRGRGGNGPGQANKITQATPYGYE